MDEQAVFDALKYRIKVDVFGVRKYYNKDDQLHRTDGPAIVYKDGSTEWYQNDLMHRTDGPAIERANGTKLWYQNGLLHRIDGPAIEAADGDEFWWLNGKPLTETEFNQAVKLL